MDMFDPRYQLEAEDQAGGRLRSPLSHEEIQHTLHALERLAWRLRRHAPIRRRRREPLVAESRRQR